MPIRLKEYDLNLYKKYKDKYYDPFMEGNGQVGSYVGRKQLVNDLYEATGVYKYSIRSVLIALEDVIMKHIANGETVQLFDGVYFGFKYLPPKRRYDFSNPGEIIDVPPRIKAKFYLSDRIHDITTSAGQYMMNDYQVTTPKQKYLRYYYRKKLREKAEQEELEKIKAMPDEGEAEVINEELEIERETGTENKEE